MKKNQIALLGASSFLAFGFISEAPAQQAPELSQPSKTTARFISSLELNDNYDLREDSLGNALIWTNTFGAGLNDRTRTDRIFLDAQGSLRAADYPERGQDTALDDPRIVLNYLRQIDDNTLRFDANYRRVQNNFFDPLGDINDDGSIDNDAGDAIRETYGVSVGVVINDDGPVSFSFDGSYRSLNYYDNEDAPSLTDRDNYYGRTELGFRINRQVKLVVGTSYSFQDSESGSESDKTSRRVDAGLDMQINERTTALVRLGYSNVDTVRPDDDYESNEEGFVSNISFQTALTNGNVRGGISSNIDENGPRTRVTVGRLIEFENGLFDSDIGLSTSDNTDFRPVGGIRYVYRLPSSTFNFALRQNTTTDEDSRDVVNTFMNIGYGHRLTDVSSLSVSLRGGLTRYENSDQSDSERISASISYSHALTPDWSATLGARHTTRLSEEDEDAMSNAVFMTLRRDFDALR